MMTLAEILVFLAEHADLIGDLVDVIKSGGDKDSLRKAIRDVKLKVSDQAMKEEMGL